MNWLSPLTDTDLAQKILSLCQLIVWSRELEGMEEELRAALESPPLLAAPLGWAASRLSCIPTLSCPAAAFCDMHGVYDCYKRWTCKREILKVQSILPGLDHPGLSHLPLTLLCKCRASPFSLNYAEFHISPLNCKYASNSQGITHD